MISAGDGPGNGRWLGAPGLVEGCHGEPHMTELRYSVRTSTRAKHARLTVLPEDGLTVVVPRRFNPARIPALVESRLDWIRRAEERVAADREHLAALRAAPVLPERIDLGAVGERVVRRVPQGRTARARGARAAARRAPRQHRGRGRSGGAGRPAALAEPRRREPGSSRGSGSSPPSGASP